MTVIIIIIIVFIYRWPYQCSNTVFSKALLVQHGFILIRVWPLQLGSGRVTYTQRDVGTFNEETIGYSCSLEYELYHRVSNLYHINLVLEKGTRDSKGYERP